MTRLEPVVLGILAVVVGIALLLTSGCGASASATARSVVLTSAEAVVATDGPLAASYTAAAGEALQASDTIEEYRERMSPWNEVVRVQRAAITALQAAESAIDTWERVADKSAFTAIIGCAASAVRRLVDLVRQLHVDVPKLVTATSELLAQYLGGNCQETTP